MFPAEAVVIIRSQIAEWNALLRNMADGDEHGVGHGRPVLSASRCAGTGPQAPSPGAEMFYGGEPTHIYARLRRNNLHAAPGDPGHLANLRNGRLELRHVRFRRRVQLPAALFYGFTLLCVLLPKPSWTIYGSTGEHDTSLFGALMAA